jgi:hypothetical protein
MWDALSKRKSSPNPKQLSMESCRDRQISAPPNSSKGVLRKPQRDPQTFAEAMPSQMPPKAIPVYLAVVVIDVALVPNPHEDLLCQSRCRPRARIRPCAGLTVCRSRS